MNRLFRSHPNEKRILNFLRKKVTLLATWNINVSINKEKKILRCIRCHFQSHGTRNAKSRSTRSKPKFWHILEGKISSNMLCHAGPSLAYLWIVQVPNINGMGCGRFAQVNGAVGTLRQKQLGETSDMDIVVIIKMAPPPMSFSQK